MGGSSFSSTDYRTATDKLAKGGAVYARSAKARATGDFDQPGGEHLDPRLLKNGMRESCYPDGVTDILSVALVMDMTGSMGTIPEYLQKELPNIIEVLIEQGISDHPQVMFIGHDDEYFMPRAAFQISQFESGSKELLEAMNSLIISGNGGGNSGESYHLAFYGLGYHTKLESVGRDGEKGIAIFINDEPAFFDGRDWRTEGTTPALAKETFGDTLQSEVSMLESVKKTLEQYEVVIIRPLDVSWGRDKNVTAQWREILIAAGGNPQNVIEVDTREAILSAAVLAISQIKGGDHSALVEVLKSKGAIGVDAAAEATKSLVPSNGTAVASATSTADVDTGSDAPRVRE